MPRDAEAFIHHLQTTLRQWLATLNGGLPENPKVRLRQQGQNFIHLTPLERQPDPPHTAVLKREIGRRWSDVELIDIFKEVDLRLPKQFAQKAERRLAQRIQDHGQRPLGRPARGRPPVAQHVVQAAAFAPIALNPAHPTVLHEMRRTTRLARHGPLLSRRWEQHSADLSLSEHSPKVNHYLNMVYR